MTCMSSRGSHIGLSAYFSSIPCVSLRATWRMELLGSHQSVRAEGTEGELVCAKRSLGLLLQVYFPLFGCTEGRGAYSSLHLSCSEMGDGKRRISWMLRSQSVSLEDSERQRQLAGRRLLNPESCPLAPYAHFCVLTHHTHG